MRDPQKTLNELDPKIEHSHSTKNSMPVELINADGTDFVTKDTTRQNSTKRSGQHVERTPKSKQMGTDNNSERKSSSRKRMEGNQEAWKHNLQLTRHETENTAIERSNGISQLYMAS